MIGVEMNEPKGMTLIEAMKELKQILKDDNDPKGKRRGKGKGKIQSKMERIAKNCATLEIEKLPFETDEKQKAEVASLIQGCEDLEERARWLYKRITYTNLMTKVEIGGKMYSITELLFILNQTSELMQSVFETLNENHAKMRLKSFTIEAGKQIPIITHYKETFKMAKLEFWQELSQSIERRLEVVNATTQLLELPE